MLLSSSSFTTALTLGSVPALCMLIATCIGLGKKVPPSIAGALQHFAAGVLLCTIGTELLPEMVNATGWAENVSMGIGFFMGVSVLIFIGSVLPSVQDEEQQEQEALVLVQEQKNDKEEEQETELSLPRISSSPQLLRLRQRQSLMATAFKHTASENCIQRLSETCVNEENQPLVVPNGSSFLLFKQKPFPSALVLAVAIDSALDGLLIGIASAAGPSAGPMMSASLSVEMSFLGLTLATALHGHAAIKSLPAAVFGPAVLVLAAGVGGFMAATFRQDPVLFVGLLSFGTSALLFMVAEELLLEAHEQGEHLWWVDLQLYTGFFASILAGKFMPSG